jgi:hypothetical protein
MPANGETVSDCSKNPSHGPTDFRQPYPGVLFKDIRIVIMAATTNNIKAMRPIHTVNWGVIILSTNL